MSVELICGDSLNVLRGMAEASVDAVVTDPPYGLAFMGKRWDYDVPSVEIWAECLRVLKPGGYLLAFAGTRTQHRMAVRIEDAGFEIRDMIAWVYGSGFPKSLDVLKAIDKAAGAEREVLGVSGKSGSARKSMAGDFAGGEYMATAPATDAARQWQGWGTALKPSLEPVTVARKPLDGIVAENVLQWGTGALNIDGCRVPIGAEYDPAKVQRQQNHAGNVDFGAGGLIGKEIPTYNAAGRWPANFIHDGSQLVLDLFPDTGKSTDSAARFFYCAKASKRERGEGNTHPTVKPIDLMCYLVRLVTPKGGVVLDPFMGSGSTGVAALQEGCDFIGIEREAEYVKIARKRIESQT